MGIVDACLHPLARTEDELRGYLPPAWRHKLFPGPDRTLYTNPRGDYLDDAWPEDGRPGSDPALAAAWLAEHDVDHAILLPLTRGLNPDVDLGSVICRAVNDWLADTWLGRWNGAGRYHGSIRVNPEDSKRAIEEIERWADHPHMVQVAVPLEALNYYGKRQYFDVWAAAARHDLPVALHSDWAPGIDYDPAPVGSFRHFAEFSTLASCNFVYHLSSLVTEGVFDRLENLRIVFADGGIDMVGPFSWRMDGYWRATRFETPWTRQLPTSYLREHVRFCVSGMEGPEDTGKAAGWLELVEAEDLLLYAGNYPHWPAVTPDDVAPASVSGEVRRRVLSENARALYRLPGEGTQVISNIGSTA